ASALVLRSKNRRHRGDGRRTWRELVVDPQRVAAGAGASRSRPRPRTKERYPKGHADLAWSTNYLADVLRLLGAPERALPYYEGTRALRQALYPRDLFPKGHEDWAIILSPRGFALRVVGAREKGLPFAEQAVAMCRALSPPEEFPKGDVEFASSLDVLA